MGWEIGDWMRFEKILRDWDLGEEFREGVQT
jgi:hypothetical protein